MTPIILLQLQNTFLPGDQLIRAGFLVNPVAGCGQFLNLKGSDSLTPSTCPRAIALEKAVEFLNEVQDLEVQFFTASGQMGEDAFHQADLSNYRIIEEFQGECSGTQTKDFIQELKKQDVSVLVFFGGDGTARDISDAGWVLPSIGVPLGTKMYSSVFAINIASAIELFRDLVGNRVSEFAMEEVIDLDEAEYIHGFGAIKPYGHLKVPVSESIMSVSKAEYPENSIEGIAEYVVEHMGENVNYVVGPGSTCKGILKELELEGSLLGFDLVRNSSLIGTDLSESEIYQLTSDKTVIILSPIGGQGFLLGRGNKQLSGRIISEVGFNNIIVVSSESKLRSLKRLYVDVEPIPETRPTFVRVLFGYGRYKMIPVEF